jgi:hypothetical protein
MKELGRLMENQIYFRFRIISDKGDEIENLLFKRNKIKEEADIIKGVINRVGKNLNEIQNKGCVVKNLKDINGIMLFITCILLGQENSISSIEYQSWIEYVLCWFIYSDSSAEIINKFYNYLTYKENDDMKVVRDFLIGCINVYYFSQEKIFKKANPKEINLDFEKLEEIKSFEKEIFLQKKYNLSDFDQILVYIARRSLNDLREVVRCVL